VSESDERGNGEPLVEILSFDGCPNQLTAIALVERVSGELGLDPEIRLVSVPDQATARRLHFLGSPTIRVAGRDVDPYTEECDDYTLSCRVFRTGAGIAGQPDERWVRDALQRELHTAAVDALRAADIRPERRGRARTHPLTSAEREFYFWILRQFAAARPPSGEATRAAVARFELDSTEAIPILAREDLVHVDATGRPVVAYPFSAEPRGHRVLIDGERWVEAMCAIDALGIAPMLGLPIEVYSHDPVSGGETWVRLDPGEGAWWEPQEAVVVSGSASCEGPSYCGCCDVLNFFERRENAERYLAEHREVAGSSISLPEAIEAGRIVFGDVF
jgi:hypothetical protein